MFPFGYGRQKAVVGDETKHALLVRTSGQLVEQERLAGSANQLGGPRGSLQTRVAEDARAVD